MIVSAPAGETQVARSPTPSRSAARVTAAFRPGRGRARPQIRPNRFLRRAATAAPAIVRNSETARGVESGNRDAARSRGPSCQPGRCSVPAEPAGRFGPEFAIGASNTSYTHSSAAPRSGCRLRPCVPRRSLGRRRSSAPASPSERRNQSPDAAGRSSEWDDSDPG
jgi:hypothetical protein